MPKRRCARAAPEPRSAAPSEGMPDGDKIQSRDHLQPASPDRDDRPPALPSRQAPIFLPTASDDHHNADIQAVAIGGNYAAPIIITKMSRARAARSGLLAVMAVLALAVLVGTFAYRAMFGGYVFPAFPLIVIAGTGPNNIVRNNSDISTVPISSKPSAGARSPCAGCYWRSLLIRPWRQLLIQHLSGTTCPAARLRLPRSRTRLRRSCRLRLCPLLPRRCLQQHLSRRLPRLRRLYRSRLIQMLGGALADDYPWRGRAATPSSITI